MILENFKEVVSVHMYIKFLGKVIQQNTFFPSHVYIMAQCLLTNPFLVQLTLICNSFHHCHMLAPKIPYIVDITQLCLNYLFLIQ